TVSSAKCGAKRNCSKNQVVCARCHLVGLASAIDCTTWSSALKEAVRRSVSARTARKASRQMARGWLGAACEMVAVSPSSLRRRVADDEGAGGLPHPGVEGKGA